MVETEKIKKFVSFTDATSIPTAILWAVRCLFVSL